MILFKMQAKFTVSNVDWMMPTEFVLPSIDLAYILFIVVSNQWYNPRH